MKLHKALIRSSLGCRFVGVLLASLIAGLMLTIRWSRKDQSHITAFLDEKEGVIMVFWCAHGVGLFQSPTPSRVAGPDAGPAGWQICRVDA